MGHVYWLSEEVHREWPTEMVGVQRAGNLAATEPGVRSTGKVSQGKFQVSSVVEKICPASEEAAATGVR